MKPVYRSIYKDQKRLYFSSVKRARGLFHSSQSKLATVQSLLSPGCDQRSLSSMKSKTDQLLSVDTIIKRLSSFSPKRTRDSPDSPMLKSLYQDQREPLLPMILMKQRKTRCPSMPRLSPIKQRKDAEGSLQVLISRCEKMLLPKHHSRTSNK